MIARLAGTLAEKTPGRIIIDVQGVGYNLQVPLSTFYVIGDAGTAVTLRVHTHVREDVIALYGFATGLEQELFERLISISGIGPKLALAVLSGMEPPDLVRAISSQDVARLTSIPGIGKKTAERIGLELKDRLPKSVQAAADAAKPASAEDQLRADLLSALLNLGYQRQSADKAIEKELKVAPDATFEQALRSVLRALMK
ncbi:MAG: Holliday junction branch migration protein RuvA [Acidobacteria bacterium]|nr:Holliday junction branch migration protein RuvA [Acidobacteriota bacterium]